MNSSKSFTELNQYIDNKLGNGDICTVGHFSFIKIFQHALTYSECNNKNKLIQNHIHRSYFIQLLVYQLKSLRKRIPKIKLNSVVTIEQDRFIQDQHGEHKSIYFENLCKLLPRNSITRLGRSETPIPLDYYLPSLSGSLPIPDHAEKAMIKTVHSVYKKARRSQLFSLTELKYIQSSLHIFLEEFRFHYHIFKNEPVATIVFICHYHKEGLIAAAKVLGIRCIELQHGLIAKNDIYYLYNAAYKKNIAHAFFAESIFVYGPKWKDLLSLGCEFNEKQILIGGDYLFRTDKIATSSADKKNLILICSQKNMHDDFIPYCDILARFLEQHREWDAIIKLHPLEPHRELYKNKLSPLIKIAETNERLDDLLKLARIQISIYSTTFYDALGFNVLNLSIQNFGSSRDYAADIVRDGLALPLTIEQDPIQLYSDLEKKQISFPDRELYYAAMDTKLLTETIC